METAAESTPRNRLVAALIVFSAVSLSACREDPIKAVEALQKAGSPAKALREVETALAHKRTKDRTYWELVLLKAQLLKRQDRKAALTWLQSVDPQSANPTELAAWLVGEEATIESDLGRFREADQNLIEALRLIGSSRPRIAAVMQVRRARALIGLGNPEEAEQCLGKAEEYTHATNDHSLDPFILHDRGQVLANRNRFEEAIVPLDGALMQFRLAKQDAAVAQATISLAWCYYRLGQVEKALELYQQVLAIAAPEDRHLALGHLGNIFYEQRDFVRAADSYRQAASGAKGRDQSYYPKWLDNLAIALIEQGMWSEAEPFNREALRLESQSSSEPPPALVTSGRIEIQKGNYHDAERILKQAAESRHNIAIALDAYTRLVDVYTRMNRPADVTRELEAALALADETSGKLREDENKLSYLSSLIDLHRKYVDFLVERGDKAGAFAVAESSRARLLRERLNLPRTTARGHTIAEYQAAARASGTTFLAYWIGPEHSYLWAISGTQFLSLIHI